MKKSAFWLSTVEGALPDRAIERIELTATRLAQRDIGRPSRLSGLREGSVRNAPYIIVYEVNGDDIELLAVDHTSQDR